jgi:hypothetical protein
MEADSLHFILSIPLRSFPGALQQDSLALGRKGSNAALFGQHARCIFLDETPK